jgi:uncharacterized protein YbaR (Trm112 family)/SAM-dependent methyltransferase
MQAVLMEMLVCPVCHEELAWTITAQEGNRINSGEATCQGCAAAYPIRDDIALFLTPDLPRNDLWEQVDRGLVRYLQAHPDLEQQLLTSPIDELAPADQLFRAFLLEEQEQFAEAKVAEQRAFTGLYTEAYRHCWQSQIEYVLTELADGDRPVVDLACGRGYLVEQMARRLNGPLIATDFSPRVLQRNRQQLRQMGLYEQVSLLAFDARRTPFRGGAVTTMTTNLGLPNIEEPGHLIRELRRVVSGQFLAVSFFLPETDEANGEIIRQAKLDTVLYRPKLEAVFAAANWPLTVENVCTGLAQPTPPSVILAGIRPDGLPVTETMLEWGVLRATV